MAEEDLMHHFKEEDRVMSMVNNDDMNLSNSLIGKLSILYHKYVYCDCINIA
ncbi:hypothetical protein K502DRAFT_353954 [Neoconidiobolus thromboides FSU 785]|nr:hypothetical protein K502DRAFT_353954 [Neoconidiobolus thromboides FSU 785]